MSEIIYADRVQETTNTTGTGNYVLDDAVAGFQTFASAIGANNTTHYCCTDGTDWEVGQGTLQADGVTLSRTVLASSHSGAAVNWGAGEKKVFVTAPAVALNGFAQVDNGGNAKGNDAINLQPSRDNDDQVASGSGSIAIGQNSKASHFFAQAVGNRAQATANRATVSGYQATASGADAVAHGSGANAMASSSVALGLNQEARISHTLAAPAIITKRGLSVAGDYPFRTNNGASIIITSALLGLAPPPPWAASTSYNDGDLVIPTTPNGYQYIATFAVPGPLTSNAVEPSWPTTAGWSEFDFNDEGEWICIDPANYVIDVPAGATFYLEEAGIICDSLTGLTTQPSVSFGVSGDLTKFLAATATVDLDVGKTIQRYFPGDLSNENGGVTTLAAAITTAATATEMLGRFYWRGLLVED